jgi:hypothetical protein
MPADDEAGRSTLPDLMDFRRALTKMTAHTVNQPVSLLTFLVSQISLQRRGFSPAGHGGGTGAMRDITSRWLNG